MLNIRLCSTSNLCRRRDLEKDSEISVGTFDGGSDTVAVGFKDIAIVGDPDGGSDMVGSGVGTDDANEEGIDDEFAIFVGSPEDDSVVGLEAGGEVRGTNEAKVAFEPTELGDSVDGEKLDELLLEGFDFWQSTGIANCKIIKV